MNTSTPSAAEFVVEIETIELPSARITLHGIGVWIPMPVVASKPEATSSDASDASK